jgi:hypothetical protein
MHGAQPAHGFKASPRTVLKVGANQRYAGLTDSCLRKNLLRTGGSSHDFDMPAASESSNQKLAVHEILIGYNEADAAASIL